MYGQSPSVNCAQSEQANAQQVRTTNQSLLCLCSAKVLCFLAILFVGAVGLILGAYFSVPLLLSIAAVIVGAVILLVLIIALIIYRACNNCSNACRCRCICSCDR